MEALVRNFGAQVRSASDGRRIRHHKDKPKIQISGACFLPPTSIFSNMPVRFCNALFCYIDLKLHCSVNLAVAPLFLLVLLLRLRPEARILQQLLPVTLLLLMHQHQSIVLPLLHLLLLQLLVNLVCLLRWPLLLARLPSVRPLDTVFQVCFLVVQAARPPFQKPLKPPLLSSTRLA